MHRVATGNWPSINENSLIKKRKAAPIAPPIPTYKMFKITPHSQLLLLLCATFEKMETFMK